MGEDLRTMPAARLVALATVGLPDAEKRRRLDDLLLYVACAMDLTDGSRGASERLFRMADLTATRGDLRV
ncbi:MAG: hypothetical protein JSR98_20105 [Proteobacteria bacterium]|nr:hypothetical protein [Pseudomonadota bacterium]